MCQIDPQTNTCLRPGSLVRFFDGTYAHINPIFNDTNFDNIQQVALAAMGNNATRERFVYFLGKDFTQTNGILVTSITRSTIFFGQPHEIYEDSQDTRVDDYSGKEMKPILERYMDDKSLYDMVFRSVPLWQHDVRNQAFKDMYLAGASMGFIFLCILFHTRSLWISGLAVFSIIGSFITGNLIYNIVYGYKYLGFFHVLGLFIILGIGADNIFVFYDMWRASDVYEYRSLAHRLSDVYKRAVVSMFFTTLTTVVAFLSTAILPLLGIRAFGLFAATVVAVNFMSVILQFPIVVLMFHKYFQHTKWPCCVPCMFLRRRLCPKEDTVGADNEQKDHNRKPQTLHNSHNGEVKANGRLGQSNEAYTLENDEYNHKQMRVVGNQWTPSEMPYAYDPIGYYGNGGQYDVPEKDKRLAQKKSTDGHKKHKKEKRYNSNERDSKRRLSVENRSYEKGQWSDHYFYTGNKDGSSNPPVQKYHIDTQNHQSAWQQNNRTAPPYGRTAPPYDRTAPPPSADMPPPLAEKPLKKKSASVLFFSNYYFRFVTHPIIRWIIPLVIFGILGFFIYQASRLTSSGEIVSSFTMYLRPVLKHMRGTPLRQIVHVCVTSDTHKLQCSDWP